MEKKVLLAVEKLTISFKKEKEFVPVVHGLTYHLYENEISKHPFSRSIIILIILRK